MTAINVNLKNFLGVVNEVLQYGFNDGPQVNRGRVEAWVNEALFQIARQVDAPEFQEIQEITLETGVWEIPLPEGFLRVQDIYFPEYESRLKPLDLQQFNTKNPAKVSGAPQQYTLFKDKLWIFPSPSPASGEQLLMHYIKQPPALVGQTDIPLLNPNYWHLLIDYAICRAFEGEDDYEAAQQFQGRYQRDLAAYATDVQSRMDDRPRIVDGTWGGEGPGQSYGSRL